MVELGGGGGGVVGQGVPSTNKKFELELARKLFRGSSSSLLKTLKMFKLELELARKLCKNLSPSLSLKLGTQTSRF